MDKENEGTHLMPRIRIIRPFAIRVHRWRVVEESKMQWMVYKDSCQMQRR